MAKNAQRSKMVKVSSSDLPEPEKTTGLASMFDKNGILSKVTAKQSRKTGDSDAPKSTAQGAKCQKFTHERGTLTVLERWAFLACFPRALAMIPNAMKAERRQLLWPYETLEGGRSTKVPLRVDGRRASTTNPEHFAANESVVRAAPRLEAAGPGFVLRSPAVDLDHVRDPADQLVVPPLHRRAPSLMYPTRRPPRLTGAGCLIIELDVGRDLGRDRHQTQGF
jgi:hypothetical protein